MTVNLHKQLSDILSRQQVITDASEVSTYGYDNSRLKAQADAVVFPHNTEQVQAIVKFCQQHKIAITARGKGTGTTGATVPTQQGIILSTENMLEKLDIDAANRMATVSPGYTNQQLQQAAAKHGFFWPPDPTSAAICTIGGNLAYNSAGPRAVKYGTPRENTLALTAISGSGEILHTGSATTKGVVGYDLTRLLIGSEGTLAIITEAKLKLTPLPETIKTLQFAYRTIHAAAHAVSAIMQQAYTPYALEFIDGNAINMIRSFTDPGVDKDTAAVLMIEVDGNETAIDIAIDSIIAAANNEGLSKVTRANTAEEVAQIWKTRKSLSPALRNIAPKKINEDVVVPVSHIPDLIETLEKLSKKHQITIVNFGHAGNGNLHVNLLVNPDDKEEMQRAEHCLKAIFDKVLSLNGTLSGEHGVGLVKRDYIAQEISQSTLAIMHKIKQQFDPDNILNPGKTLPPIREQI